MKRVLISGGSGFVGANLARALLQLGHEVHLFLRPATPAWRLDDVRGDLRIHELTLLDAATVQRTVGTLKPHWIFHLATHGAYAWQTGSADVFLTNVQGTLNLLHACTRHGFETFINTGSSSEYGPKNHAPAENECLEPVGDYAVSKACATLLCRSTALQLSLPIQTLRLYSVYGPWEDPRRLIPSLIRHAASGQLPPLVDADAAHDFVYIDDVVAAYLAAAKHPRVAAIYNIGSGRQLSLGAVVEITRRMLDVRSEPRWGSMPSRPWDVPLWQADIRRAASELGWAPRIDFEEGFRRTAEWFRQTPPRTPL